MSAPPSSRSERRALRRRFVLRAAPLAVLLIVGLVLALETSGAVAQLGYLVLTAGVGLAVALVPLFFDHNPISKE